MNIRVCPKLDRELTTMKGMHCNECDCENRPVDRVVIRNPDPQIRAWINNSQEQMEFWKNVQRMGSASVMGKTTEQVEALVNYFEGKFDMACNIRDFVSQKTISE